MMIISFTIALIRTLTRRRKRKEKENFIQQLVLLGLAKDGKLEWDQSGGGSTEVALEEDDQSANNDG